MTTSRGPPEVLSPDLVAFFTVLREGLSTQTSESALSTGMSACVERLSTSPEMTKWLEMFRACALTAEVASSPPGVPPAEEHQVEEATSIGSLRNTTSVVEEATAGGSFFDQAVASATTDVV